MFDIMITASFDSCHFLPHYNGPCKNMHGHSWKIQVCYRRLDLDNEGIAIDMRLLKAQLRNVIHEFDHTNLNRILAHPTAENIAVEIARRLAHRAWCTYLNGVCVEETEGCKVIYHLPTDKDRIPTSIRPTEIKTETATKPETEPEPETKKEIEDAADTKSK